MMLKIAKLPISRIFLCYRKQAEFSTAKVYGIERGNKFFELQMTTRNVIKFVLTNEFYAKTSFSRSSQVLTLVFTTLYFANYS